MTISKELLQLLQNLIESDNLEIPFWAFNPENVNKNKKDKRDGLKKKKKGIFRKKAK